MPTPSAAMLSEAFFKFKLNAGEGLCWVSGCRRNSKSDRCMCHKHEMQRWRSKNKESSSFCTLRDHAKGRKLEFDLTPDYWAGLTDAFGFFDQSADEFLTIDRVDPVKGYLMGNLRVVSISLNCYKSGKERYLPEHVQAIVKRNRAKAQDENAKFLAMKPEPEPDALDFEDDIEDDPNYVPF